MLLSIEHILGIPQATESWAKSDPCYSYGLEGNSLSRKDAIYP